MYKSSSPPRVLHLGEGEREQWVRRRTARKITKNELFINILFLTSFFSTIFFVFPYEFFRTSAGPNAVARNISRFRDVPLNHIKSIILRDVRRRLGHFLIGRYF